jgi:hypothetical protein
MTTTTVVRPSYLAAGLGVLAIAMVLAIRTPWSADASAARASNVAVDCEPAQRALVRQIVTSGDPQITVQCVSGPAAQTVAYVDASGRVYQATAPLGQATAPLGQATAPLGQAGAPLAGPAVVPAVYNTPVVTEREVIREVERPAPVTRTSTSSTTRAGEPKRDWKKTALVIGGSAGAGAGIGAIVGGKKGAAIGAAVGGGAGTLYEVLKKK